MNVLRLLLDFSYLTAARLFVLEVGVLCIEHYLYDNRTVSEIGVIPPVVIVIIGAVISLLAKKECVSRGIPYRFARVLWWVLGSAVVSGGVMYLCGSDGAEMLTVCLYIGGVLGVMMNPIIKSKEDKETDVVETQE